MVMDKTTMSVQELSAQMGISLPKAYALGKTAGLSYHQNRYQNSYKNKNQNHLELYRRISNTDITSIKTA